MEWIGKVFQWIGASIKGAWHGAQLAKENEALKEVNNRLLEENNKLHEIVDFRRKYKVVDGLGYVEGNPTPVCQVCADSKRELIHLQGPNLFGSHGHGHMCFVCNSFYTSFRPDE